METKCISMLVVISLSILPGLSFAEECTLNPGTILPETIAISPSSTNPLPTQMRFTNAQGEPIRSGQATIEFPAEAFSLLALCGTSHSQCTHSYAAITDDEGYARFYIAGGGCWDENVVPLEYLPVIKLNGVVICRRGVSSPDVWDANQEFSWQLWSESPPCGPGTATVGNEDAQFFTTVIKFGQFTPCLDLNGDGLVGVADAVAGTLPIKYGHTCGEGQ
jgi:hypothetical protein